MDGFTRSTRLQTLQLIFGVATAALILTQAVLASQSRLLFGRLSIGAHEAVGNATFGVVVVALVVLLRTRADRTSVVLAVSIVVAVTMQLGLGYSDRQTATAAAWHIVVGVGLFGLSSVNLYRIAANFAGGRSARRDPTGPGC